MGLGGAFPEPSLGSFGANEGLGAEQSGDGLSLGDSVVKVRAPLGFRVAENQQIALYVVVDIGEDVLQHAGAG